MASIVGEFQIGAPAGALRIAPAEFFAGCHRFLRDRIGTPDELSRVRIDSRYTATKCAALIGRIGRRRPFVGRHRHVEATVEETWRAGDGDSRMCLDVCLPLQRARLRVHRVGIAIEVPEIQTRLRLGIAARPRLQRRARTNFGVSEERPAHATRVEIQCIDGTVLAADEHRTCADGRLRTRSRRAGDTQRPT